MIMTPTREQFKELMTFIKNAQEKEDKVNDALRKAPKGEAKYWIDEKEYNVSDIDAFYDYLVEISNESNNKTEE